MSIILVLLTFPCSAAVLHAAAQPKTIVVPDEYQTLNAAISQASDGDIILIRNGKYSEQSLVINKSLTIKSEFINGAEISLHPPKVPVVILGGENATAYDHPIRIYADDVEVSGCKITSDGGDAIANGNRIQIVNTTMAMSFYLTGNQIKIRRSAMWAIVISGSNNTIKDNQIGGITSSGSFNSIINNEAGSMALGGSRNLVDGNSFIGSGGVGIWIIDADYNTITNNFESGGNVGIAIGYAEPGSGSYNIFAGNTVEQASLYGILVQNGSGNVFYGNRIANNSGSGLGLGGRHVTTENNLFFHNIFKNNTANFEAGREMNLSNAFDSGAEGNYWDDYLAKYPDAKQSSRLGVGDTPYLLHDNIADNYPLLNEPDVSAGIPVLPYPWSLLSIISQEPEPSETIPSQAGSNSSSTSQPKPFPWLPVAAVSAAFVAVVAVAAVVYVKKRRR